MQEVVSTAFDAYVFAYPFWAIVVSTLDKQYSNTLNTLNRNSESIGNELDSVLTAISEQPFSLSCMEWDIEQDYGLMFSPAWYVEITPSDSKVKRVRVILSRNQDHSDQIEECDDAERVKPILASIHERLLQETKRNYEVDSSIDLKG